MPKRLRPTAPIADDAILVGDPGRALLLAQELLEQPKMSNHARGLWGYWGRTPAGRELTIQATGMGGPSAAVVLADLAVLGVRRAVRVGTCVAVDPAYALGELLVVVEARAGGATGDPTLPDPDLAARLECELTDKDRRVAVGSFDTMPEGSKLPFPSEIGAADMQTATVLAGGRSLGIAASAILIVAETATGERIGDQDLEAAAKRAGQAASSILSA